MLTLVLFALLAGANLLTACPCSSCSCLPPCNANLQLTTNLPITTSVPITANVPISTTLPVTASVPINVAKCDCGCGGVKVSPCNPCLSKYVDIEPVCVEYERTCVPVLPRCGCRCYTDLEPTPCSCFGPALPSCGCLPVCSCVPPVSSCLEYDIVISALPPVLDYGVLAPVTTSACGYYAPSCLSAPAVNYGVPTVAAYPGVPTYPVAYGCGCPITAYGCPTLPPFPPEVSCCSQYLRKICIAPPFL